MYQPRGSSLCQFKGGSTPRRDLVLVLPLGRASAHPFHCSSPGATRKASSTRLSLHTLLSPTATLDLNLQRRHDTARHGFTLPPTTSSSPTHTLSTNTTCGHNNRACSFAVTLGRHPPDPSAYFHAAHVSSPSGAPTRITSRTTAEAIAKSSGCERVVERLRSSLASTVAVPPPIVVLSMWSGRGL